MVRIRVTIVFIAVNKCQVKFSTFREVKIYQPAITQLLRFKEVNIWLKVLLIGETYLIAKDFTFIKH